MHYEFNLSPVESACLTEIFDIAIGELGTKKLKAHANMSDIYNEEERKEIEGRYTRQRKLFEDIRNKIFLGQTK